jgi:hypothetical protein
MRTVAIITRAYDFGLNDCIGCGKPLNRWNKYVYHNKKCLMKYSKFLDKAELTNNSNINPKGIK